MSDDNGATSWQAVTGKCLAYLCLVQADLRDKGLAIQGRFLESLGLSRKDAAGLLGTTPASLTELYRQAKSRKGGRSGSRKGK